MSQPLTKFANGQIQVSVWENEGKNGPYCSVRIGRRYRDPKTGEWKDSNSFFASELVSLRELLTQTSEFLDKGFPQQGAAQPAGEALKERGRVKAK